jgi:hypothetical protein
MLAFMSGYILAEMYWALALGEDLSTPGLKKNARQKDQEMTNYPVEFHRRLEQKDEDEKDKDWRDEPAVVREPDED